MVGLALNKTTITHSEFYNTSKDKTINTKKRDLESKFGIDNIAMDNQSLFAKYIFAVVVCKIYICGLLLLLLSRQLIP